MEEIKKRLNYIIYLACNDPEVIITVNEVYDMINELLTEENNEK